MNTYQKVLTYFTMIKILGVNRKLKSIDPLNCVSFHSKNPELLHHKIGSNRPVHSCKSSGKVECKYHGSFKNKDFIMTKFTHIIFSGRKSYSTSGGSHFNLEEFTNDFNSYMRYVKSPEDALFFRKYIFEKYPEGKAVMYCRLITDKLDQQKALHAFIKNMKFLEDLLIHKTLGSIHVIPISSVAIPQEDFSKLFHEFLYDTEKNFSKTW